MGFWVMDDGSIKELNALQEAAVNTGQITSAIDGPYEWPEDIPGSKENYSLVMEPQHPLEHPISVLAIGIILVAIFCKIMNH